MWELLLAADPIVKLVLIALVIASIWSWAVVVEKLFAIGGARKKAGEFEEAETVYRADLGLDGSLPRPSQHPRNVWALHGLNECLEKRGETVEQPHVRIQLDQALARSDIKIRASCLCRSAA